MVFDNELITKNLERAWVDGAPSRITPYVIRQEAQWLVEWMPQCLTHVIADLAAVNADSPRFEALKVNGLVSHLKKRWRIVWFV